MTQGRALIVAAGLLGALGVVMSAAGAHVPGGAALGTAGTIALAQAPAALAVGLAAAPTRLLAFGAWLIALGALLFSAALALPVLYGLHLPMAAPTGGFAMIGGWLVVLVAGLLRR